MYPQHTWLVATEYAGGTSNCYKLGLIQCFKINDSIQAMANNI